jgi:hypothetical protein
MDVYLSIRRDLLVVKKGCPIPPVAPPGSWRKSKKRIFKVSEEIRSALQTQGYYMRKLRDLHADRRRQFSIDSITTTRAYPPAIVRDEQVLPQFAGSAGRVPEIGCENQAQ